MKTSHHRDSLSAWWGLVKRAGTAWIDDYAPSMGAALSYYTVFSLAPTLLIVISVAGLIFGAEAARGEIFGQLRGLMGADAAKAIEDVLTSVSKPAEGIAATFVGLVLLLIGATTVFGELQDALDRIWRAPAVTASMCRRALRISFEAWSVIGVSDVRHSPRPLAISRSAELNALQSAKADVGRSAENGRKVDIGLPAKT